MLRTTAGLKWIVVLLGAIAVTCVSARNAAAGPAPAFVYALTEVDGGSNQIHGFHLNRATGALTPIPGFPIASGGTGAAALEAEQLAYAAGRLVVINDGSDTLSVFNVNPASGALTPLPYSPVALGPGSWLALSVHPGGSPVAVADVATNRMASIVLTATSATAAAGSPYPMGGGVFPRSIAFSRDGRYVYGGGYWGDQFAGFSVAAGTGVLTALPGSPYASGAFFPAALATDRAGRLFLESGSFGLIRVYTTSSGVPTPVTGSPFVTGIFASPARGLVHPSGFYMQADRYGDRIGVYRISGSGAATTVAPVSGSPFAASGGRETATLALSQDGKLLVAGHGIGRNLSVFRVNLSTGGLTSLGTQAPDTLGAVGYVSGMVLVPRPAIGDFDGDARADIAVYRPSTGQWLVGLSAIEYSGFMAPGWGIATDKIVPGDYDGDGKTDLAVYRPSDGGWYIVQSSTDYSTAIFHIWGTSTDLPAPADFDGDGKTDLVFFRPSTGQWFIKQSSTNFTTGVAYTWGTVGDVPVPGHYDEDSKADLVVFRPSTGTWWVLKSATGFNYSMASLYTLGSSSDVAVPGDYDGDGNTDFGVFSPSSGLWRIMLSSTNYLGFMLNTWGLGTDIPVPGDYEGDGKLDIAVYRPSTGTWYVIPSFNDYSEFLAVTWGISGDKPILGRQ